ncbi:MAG: class I SAM-dependent methyltransferase [Pirellula sp.]
MNQIIKLNLGCGPVQPKGWVNVDGSIRANIASKLNWLDNLLVKLGLFPETEFNKKTRVLNLLRPLPFPNDSVSAIYAGELWEHLKLSDAVKLTAECFRVLQAGGVIRLVVPDGIDFWSKYLALFNEEVKLPIEERSSTRLSNHTAMFFRDICTERVLLQSVGHFHKWQYDEIQLSDQLRKAGFVDVARCKFHESRIDDVNLVERSDFLIVEGVKPGKPK